jgi:CRP-like cAMP-binding protein
MDRDARPQRLLCLLPAEARTTLDSLKSFKVYPPNAVLFQQGQPADRIFVLRRGKVRLSMQSDRGGQLPPWIANPGEILGLSVCVAGGCYEGTAETMEDAGGGRSAETGVLGFPAHQATGMLAGSHPPL